MFLLMHLYVNMTDKLRPQFCVLIYIYVIKYILLFSFHIFPKLSSLTLSTLSLLHFLSLTQSGIQKTERTFPNNL